MKMHDLTALEQAAKGKVNVIDGTATSGSSAISLKRNLLLT